MWKHSNGVVFLFLKRLDFLFGNLCPIQWPGSQWWCTMCEVDQASWGSLGTSDGIDRRDGINVGPILENLTKVGRFSTLVMFLGSEDRRRKYTTSQIYTLTGKLFHYQEKTDAGSYLCEGTCCGNKLPTATCNALNCAPHLCH